MATVPTTELVLYRLELTPVNRHCRYNVTQIHFKKLCETASATIRDWRERKANRIKKISFIITLVFTLSVTPHLIVMITIFLKDDLLASMGTIPASLYQIALRSICINSVANPIIYGCMDFKFRREFGKCFTYTQSALILGHHQPNSETSIAWRFTGVPVMAHFYMLTRH